MKPWLIGIVVTIGCASYPAPTNQMLSSEYQIRTARTLGVPAYPQAALYLQLAEEQLAKAKNLLRHHKNQEAEYMLMRTDADAELALALAHENRAKEQAEKALDEIRELQQTE